jgi:hypothetical protein
MRNLIRTRWSIVQQVQQQWSCCDQSPSGILLVVEPDYLLDLYVGIPSLLLLGFRALAPKGRGSWGTYPPNWGAWIIRI